MSGQGFKGGTFVNGKFFPLIGRLLEITLTVPYAYKFIGRVNDRVSNFSG